MEDAQMIHEIIMIMNNNQYYPNGIDSNKRTIIQLQDLLEGEYGFDSNQGVKEKFANATDSAVGKEQ